MLARLLLCMPCSSSSTAYAGVYGTKGIAYDPCEKTRTKVKGIHTSGVSNDSHARQMPNHSDLWIRVQLVKRPLSLPTSSNTRGPRNTIPPRLPNARNA